MKISFVKPPKALSGALIVPVLEGEGLGAAGSALDKTLGGLLSRAMAAEDFTGKAAASLRAHGPSRGKAGQPIILLGAGKADKLDDLQAKKLGAKLATVAKSYPKVTVLAGDLGDKSAEAAAHMAHGLRMKAYRFDRYRTTQKPADLPKLTAASFALDASAAAKRAYTPLAALADGQTVTRDLVNEPANVLYPAEFAKRAKALSKLGVTVQVLGEKEMEKLGMGSLLGVGQGSVRESKLVVMKWMGSSKKTAKPVAIVGKGVTFDTGGISIKPSAGMGDMKFDMGGAGVVTGLMHALAARKAKANVIGIIGLVENMPDGNAQRPGDVVTSASGQTIEVLNTDAEGRLVLADALWYVQKKFKPAAIVDLATLTGAIIMTLGYHYAGLFSNNDELSDQLTAAGQDTGERLWRFPLGEEYDRELNSPIADMQNIGTRNAGSITAAQFLQRFIENDTPWAHLDIAGTTWAYSDKPLVSKGATAYGVALLDRFVSENYE